MKLRIVAVLAMATALMAQGPGPGPGGPPPAPNFDEVKAYLGLSDTQVSSLQQLRQQEHTAAQTLMQQIRDKERALHDLLAGGSQDAAAIGTAVLAIEALRKQGQQLHAGYTDQAVAVLTADQKTKLAALDAARRLAPAIGQATALGLLEGPGPGGPGGPGGPRPGGMMGPGPAGHGPAPAGAGAMRLRSGR